MTNNEERFKDIKSRFKTVGVAKPPSEEKIRKMKKSETASGRGRPKTRYYARSFLLREVKEADNYESFMKETPPEWLETLVKQKADKQEIINEVLSRLRKDPNERNYRLTQNILNEIGRFPDGAEILTKIINQKLVDEFLTGGER